MSFATAFAQRKCGTAEVIQQRIKDNPQLQQLVNRNEAMMQQGQQQVHVEAVPQQVTIPVVVHIVLDNPSLVTDEQVASEIAVLNRDYNAANPDISQVPPVWQPLIGNTRINFCMAQRTPDNEPTTGIIRVQTAAGQSYPITNGAPDVKYSSDGGSDGWDHTRYLNIWVTRLSGNYLGVAAPPGLGFPVVEEGVVIHYTTFGTTGSVGPTYNLGRTATHEIGHYFGLKHVWGTNTGNCTTDDGIADTPPQSNYTTGCPSFPKLDVCTPTWPGIMFMNYMDYTDDACMHLFTAGQVNRMRYVLENITSSLMTSNGCSIPQMFDNDAALVNVLSPQGKICNNNIQPVVTLRNKGLQPLSKVNIWYKVNNGALTSFSWTGNLGSLQQTTVTLPNSSVAIGNYTLTAFTQSPNGQPDGNTSNDTASTRFRYDAEATLPMEQGFEDDSFPPPGWDIYNPDHSFTWERARNVGKGSSASALMRNLGYNVNGQVDDLITPVVDPQQADSVFLFFDVAAAVYSDPTTPGNLWDTLKVIVTTDCRQTGQILYSKWGPNLITHPGALHTEFVPTASEWRRDSVDLTATIRKGKFQVAFRNISNSENNIYIDNIKIVGKAVNPTLKEKGVLVNPNPTDGQVWVTFYQLPEDLVQVSVYNVQGQLVMSKPPADIGAGNRMTFNLVNEPNGVYFVKLIYRNRANTIKIMKVR
ncbi:M43 family zinc metalloprotease [Chitinophaga sp. 212800010-3]|uniref:M43 family zinc metalloprotease n=1 Tax=unclassified Chitinophaga TaxID=2619133 RepID=UPI002DE9C8FB|nr:Por secretion system C-terminal sorting domain-containing protein [Chitinophaga sp. 212800010-3]